MNRKTVWATVLMLMLALGLLSGAAAGAELPDDLYSFEAVIDGVRYAFPCAFDELTSNGWTLKDDADAKLKPNQYSLVYFEKEGYTQMTAYAYNCYSSTRTIPDCYIGGFQLSVSSYDKLPTVSCEMPRGIALNASTTGDVIKAYGEPSSRYDGDPRVSLTYRYDGWREIEFTAGEGSIVSGIKLQNLTEPDGFVDEVGDTEAAPAVVSLYVPPEQLGENPLAHTIEIDGALYQIPAPVGTFLDNGFTIIEDKSDAVVEGAGSGWVTLLKNNQQLRTLAKNYSEDATDIRNCFVTDVSIDTLGANLPATVAPGIGIGMSRDDLLNVLADMEYQVEESSFFTHYAIADNERAANAVTVTVHKETNTVSKLSVENEIRFADIERHLAKAPAMVLAPKPLKAELTPASPAATADQISNELSDFQALVNERLYAFPIDYATLAGDGWVLDGDPESVISANSYDLLTFKLGSPMSPKTSITAYVINMTDQDKPAGDLKIAGFKISSYDDSREPRTPFALAGGIELYKSTIDDVIAAYGEPGYQNEQRSVEYEFGRYRSVKLSFDEGVLTGLDIRNFTD